MTASARTALTLASHIHTAHSDDSEWGLERLVTVLGRAGFDGALVCDHDRTMDESGWAALQRECDRISEARGFLLVPGIEYQDPDHVVHLPVYGRAPFYGRSPVIGDVLARVRGDGGAAVFAHPGRRDAWRRFDPAWSTGLSGVEVWNRKYDGIRPGAWASEASRRYDIPAMAALDWHGPRQLYPLGVRVPAPAATLSAAARADHVVDAVMAGRMRATAFGADIGHFSTGPLARAADGLEAVRRRVAPLIRRFETGMRAR